MTRLMKIRRDDVCAGCGKALPAGTRAYWLSDVRVVKCRACQEHENAATDRVVPDRAPTSTTAAAAATEPSGGAPTDAAGGSAQREYDRRSARELARKRKRVDDDAEWRQTLKEQRPVLGRITTALTPKPTIAPESQATKAWKTGAEGERRVADALADVGGIEVLHDRRVPGSRANIDHIAVGSSGVFVIDAKKYTGQVERRDVGGLFRSDMRLYVNNRDRTKLIDGVLGQTKVVSAALEDGFEDVPVSGILCFVGCEWGWVMRPKHVRGVTAIWPKALPGLIGEAGPYGDRAEAIVERLRRQLPAA